MSIPKVLFIGDKWCAGIERYGVSEWETNLWKSLQTTGLADVSTFHYDCVSNEGLKSVDSILLAKCVADTPDLICLVIYEDPGSTNKVPTYEVLQTLSNKMKIPIIAIWGDLQNKNLVRLANSLFSYIKLNVYTALKKPAGVNTDSAIFKYMWVPKDESVFYNYCFNRDIPITYVGSPKLDRLKVVEYIKNLGISIVSTGGEREKHLNTGEYATLLNRTKINLSFSLSGIFNIVTARVFETMHCGAMLLEQESKEIEHFYIPFVDYVPYTDKNLGELIRYYLIHENERAKIAYSGMLKTVNLYSSTKFWRNILEDLL
jgi:hypothetical protein